MTKRDDERVREVLARMGGPALTRVAVADVRALYERAIEGATDRDAMRRAREIGEAAHTLSQRAPDEAARYRANVSEAGDLVRECAAAVPLAVAFPLADASRAAAHAHRGADLLGEIAEQMTRTVVEVVASGGDADGAAALREMLGHVAIMRERARTSAEQWDAAATEAEAMACEQLGALLTRARALGVRLGMPDGVLPGPLRELLSIADTRGKPPPEA